MDFVKDDPKIRFLFCVIITRASLFVALIVLLSKHGRVYSSAMAVGLALEKAARSTPSLTASQAPHSAWSPCSSEERIEAFTMPPLQQQVSHNDISNSARITHRGGFKVSTVLVAYLPDVEVSHV